MFDDNDIKIFGGKISAEPETQIVIPKEKIEKAKKIGAEVAKIYIENIKSQTDKSESNSELLMQRLLLLSFTATISFEQYIENDTLVGIAQKSFLDYIKKNSSEIYTASSDTGAFSFYYLAFRRENDIERRIGQTFAMLCSHDGDPIYQELGEALYCWFSSTVKKIIENNL